MRSADFYKLVSANFSSGTNMLPVATITLFMDGIEKTVSEYGDGPVDAAYRAIAKATSESPKLLDYNVGSITGGNGCSGCSYRKNRRGWCYFSGSGIQHRYCCCKCQGIYKCAE